MSNKNIERDKKYNSHRKKHIDPIKMNFDLHFMQMACAYIVSGNQNIHKNVILLLRKLFDMINIDIFENQQECIIRYKFVLKGLEARLDKHLMRRETIIQDINGLIGNEFESIHPEFLKELSNDEIKWFEQEISSCVNAAFINNSVVELGGLCTDYFVSDYNDKTKYINLIKDKINDMQTTFRRNSIDTDEENTVFNLMDAHSSVVKAFDILSKPSSQLKTGMRGLNDILAGGFSGGRVYCFFGMPGDGKTITLLNLAVQIKEFNKDYQCKDKTKVPCIVVLTMENTANQVFETLYNIGCDSKPLKYSSEEEVTSNLNNLLSVTSESPVNIFVKYKSINAVDTNYLYTLTEDLEDNGYEVICVIQDYIKRIKPVYFSGDPRIDLGSVINDFRNFAIAKDIPVITASQFNRDGIKNAFDKIAQDKHNIVASFQKNNIGESGLIDENVDASIYLAKEHVGEDWYMGFKIDKNRYRIDPTVPKIFYQPIVSNSIKYVTDALNSKPAYKLSIAEEVYETNLVKAKTMQQKYAIKQEIKPKKTDFQNIDGQVDKTIEEINNELGINNEEIAYHDSIGVRTKLDTTLCDQIKQKNEKKLIPIITRGYIPIITHIR